MADKSGKFSAFLSNAHGPGAVLREQRSRNNRTHLLARGSRAAGTPPVGRYAGTKSFGPDWRLRADGD